MKIALAHDYLNSWGGGERVLNILKQQYPEADVFAITYDASKVEGHIDYPIQTSLLQKVPFAVRFHKWFLAWMPFAVHRMDFSGYDLIISDSSGFIKGLNKPKGALHVCYIHTPTRYLTIDKWYFKETAPKLVQWMVPPVLSILAKIDLKDSQKPDVYIANSQETAGRVEKYYHRKPEHVLFPPADLGTFYSKKEDQVKDYYLVAGRLASYKRFDLAIEACNKLGKRLVVVGVGPEEEALRAIAGSTVEFWGKPSDAELRIAYAECKAMIFPPFEDAGMTPLECMATGRPVLAYGQGGALESVVDGKTGLFFAEQTADSLIQCIEKFEQVSFDSKAIQDHATTFSSENFKRRFAEIVTAAYDQRRN